MIGQPFSKQSVDMMLHVVELFADAVATNHHPTSL